MKTRKTPVPRPTPEIAVTFRARCGSIGGEWFAGAIRLVLEGEGREAADISCAVVGDEEIHGLNRRFLRHDYPTDIITFPLEDDPLEAELVISADTARRQARDYGVTLREECARLAASVRVRRRQREGPRGHEGAGGFLPASIRTASIRKSRPYGALT